MSYIVEYHYPGLGKRQSSVWGLESDARDYASSKPIAWDARVIPSRRTPEIFPHCPGSLSQAIGGKCFACKTVVTRESARRWDEANSADMK